MPSRVVAHGPGSLFGESGFLADVELGGGVTFDDSEPMPCQTRLNLCATFVALLGFVILAFSHG